MLTENAEQALELYPTVNSFIKFDSYLNFALFSQTANTFFRLNQIPRFKTLRQRDVANGDVMTI